MSFRDRDDKNVTGVHKSVASAELVRGDTGELVKQLSFPEQQPFPDTGALMAVSTPKKSTSVATASDPSMMPGSTQSKPTTTSVRMPVVIPGNGKPKAVATRPALKRRMIVHAGVALVLLFIVGGALMAAIPSGKSQAFNLGMPFQPSTSNVVGRQNNTALIAAQAATATAVTQDGFDPGNVTFAGVTQNPVPVAQAPIPTLPPIATQAPAPVPAPVTTVGGNADSSGRFFVGQCTYWANIHYHGLTGWWVEWLGNANEWSGNAAAYGWITSAEPNPNGPSIIVLQAYTQGAGAYGHVGVVESGVSAASANANGVSVSNMNWNGGWNQVAYTTFHPGAGVTFVWHP